jgi:ATP adenylyltransferase
MDHIWSPWRLDYVTGRAPRTDGGGCVFCDPARPQDPASLVVGEGDGAYVILNRYPYNNGHLMVVPARHVSSLADLGPDELGEVARLVQRAEVVLRDAYAPHGINVGVNLGAPAGAGIHDHQHLHQVPRGEGATNVMTVVGETRVLPEDLAATAARLRPLFARHLGRTGEAG